MTGLMNMGSEDQREHMAILTIGVLRSFKASVQIMTSSFSQVVLKQKT